MVITPQSLAWSGTETATLNLAKVPGVSDYCSRGITPGILIVPSNFAGTSISIHVSWDGGTTFYELNISIDVAAGKACVIAADDVIGIGQTIVKFVSDANEGSTDALQVVPVQV